MKNVPKYQHYLPESYLYGFTNESGLLLVYDKSSSQILNKNGLSPKVFGGENHFYTIKNGDDVDTKVEDVLAIVDGIFVDIREKLRNSEQLNAEDRGNLSMVLSLFLTRGPHFKDFVENGLNQIMKKVMKVGAEHKDTFYSKLGRLGIPEERFNEMREFVVSEEYDISPSRSYSLEQMVKLSLDIAPLINMFKWTIGQVPRNTSFMTVDNPIVLIPHKDVIVPNWAGIGLLTPGVTIHFPIDKELMLGMQYTENPTDYITYGKIPGRKLVRCINHDLFVSANKYVVAKDQAWLEKIAKMAG